jgi:hypothetical protein
MVAQMKRKGVHKDEFGSHGTLTGTDAELKKLEEQLLKLGYRVEYFTVRGLKNLHYMKEGLYDAVVSRASGEQLGTVESVAEGVPTFYAQ